MNPWRPGTRSIESNPYQRTAFRVGRIPREVVGRRAILQLLNRTIDLVRSDPEAHQIAGQPVSPAEITVAQQVLLDAGRRIAEELVAHAAEERPVAVIRRLAKEAARLLPPPEGRLPAAHPAVFRDWGVELARQFLAQAPGRPDPSFGALELGLAPPYGRLED